MIAWLMSVLQPADGVRRVNSRDGILWQRFESRKASRGGVA